MGVQRRVSHLLILVGTVGLVAMACGPSGAEPTLVAPLVPPRATSTPLPVEPSANVGGSFYRPAGWDGVSDVDCSDFASRANAQSFFVGTRGSLSNDPYGLDGDHDAIACEGLP